MNQNLPVTRLLEKSLVSNSFALRSFHSLLTTKDQRPQQQNMSHNPIRGKGPPGAARSPGSRINLFTQTIISPKSFCNNENQNIQINKKQSITI